MDRSRPTELTRREALKRGAALAGAVAWVTPTLQLVGMSPAMAAHLSGTSFCVKWELPPEDTGGGSLSEEPITGPIAPPAPSETNEEGSVTPTTLERPGNSATTSAPGALDDAASDPSTDPAAATTDTTRTDLSATTSDILGAEDPTTTESPATSTTEGTEETQEPEAPAELPAAGTDNQDVVAAQATEGTWTDHGGANPGNCLEPGSEFDVQFLPDSTFGGAEGLNDPSFEFAFDETTFTLKYPRGCQLALAVSKCGSAECRDLLAPDNGGFLWADFDTSDPDFVFVTFEPCAKVSHLEFCFHC